MIIHTYTICRNEEYMLPYFLAHYSTFSQQIFIIDDQSTDRTRDIAMQNPKVQLFNYPYAGINERELAQTYQDFYKKYSRGKADWVICADADEFVYNPNIKQVFISAKKSNCQAITTVGYFMVANALPVTQQPLYAHIKRGLRVHHYDKMVVFDPSVDVEFGDGRHCNKIMTPNIKCQRRKLMLLHYCYLSEQYIRERISKNYARITEHSRRDEEKEYRIQRALISYKQALNNCEQVL